MSIEEIRAAVHEAVAAELEEAQANQSQPLTSGLQHIYLELGEMRALLQILISAVAQAAEQGPALYLDEKPEESAIARDEGGQDQEREPEEGNVLPSRARLRAPAPFLLGDSYTRKLQGRQGVQS